MTPKVGEERLRQGARHFEKPEQMTGRWTGESVTSEFGTSRGLAWCSDINRKCRATVKMTRLTQLRH